MKQKLFTCAAALVAICSSNVWAQSGWNTTNPSGPLTTNSNTTDVIIDGTSRLGINTTTPTAALTINGEVDFQDNGLSWPTYRHIRAHNKANGLALFAHDGWADGAGMILNGNANGGGEGDITISAGEGNSGNGGNIAFSRWSGGIGGYWTTNMYLNKDGDLDVRGDVSISGDVLRFYNPGATVNWNRYLLGNTNESFALFSNDNNWNNSSGIMLNSSAHSTEPGSITLVASGGTTPASDPAFNFVLWHGAGWNPVMSLNKGGDLGISGSTMQYGPGASWNRYLLGNTTSSFAMFAGSDWNSGAGIMLNGVGSGGSDDGDIHIVAGNGSGSGIINFARWNGSGWTPNMIIDKDGKVSIGGVSTPGTYRLYVKEGILTEKIKVAMSGDPSNWSDFVFADDYNLKSLDEVENYIKENKHLPEIPSTEEVHKEGLDLAQMDAKLLQKIEELTLYIIEQNKKMQSQQSEIDKLKASLKK